MENIINLKNYKENRAEAAVRRSSEIVERNNDILEKELMRDEAGEKRLFNPSDYGRMLKEMHEANKKTDAELRKLGYITD